jgi:hypothetical protein
VAVIVANCPRCKSNNMTFDVTADVLTRVTYDWQSHHEVFGVCRHCRQPTIWAIDQRDYADSDFLQKNPALAKIQESLNNYFDIDGYICLKDMGVIAAPEHVPNEIAKAFREGATSVVTDCPTPRAQCFD